MKAPLSMFRCEERREEGRGEVGRDRLVPIVTLVTVIWPGGSMGSWEGVSLSLSLSLSPMG